MCRRATCHVAALWVVLLAPSCARHGQRVRESEAASLLQAMAVAPLELTFRGAPYESQLRTEDVLTVLWEESAIGVVTPGEFRLSHDYTSTLLAGTDLVLRARALNIDPRRLSVLRGHAELVTQGGTTTARVALTLVDASGARLAAVSTQRELPPFAQHPSHDPRPELRAAVVLATRRLIERCAARFSPWPRTTFKVRTNPAVVLARAGAWQLLLAREKIERGQEALRVAHYFAPQTPWLYVQWLFNQAGTGLCLEQDGPGGLRAGDCITQADGRPLDGPHAFARMLATAHHQLTLTILRPSSPAPLQLVWPAVGGAQ